MWVIANPLDQSARADADGVGTGAGSVAAAVAAAAAALAAMVARSSPGWVDAGAVAAQAEALRERLLRLAPANAEAYAAARVSLSAEGGGDDDLGRSLSRAAAMPLEIADAAASVAELAAVVAEGGYPELRGDAVAAAVLAEGAARAAAQLVAVNLAVRPDDELAQRSRKIADDASASAARAIAATV